MRILIIDDSEVVLAVLEETLQAAGFAVEVCSNPMLAAAKLRQFGPQLLLLDVDMPAVTGPEVAAALRRADALRNTQVVLYSATDDMARLAQQAKECGAVRALSKSVTGAALASELRALCEVAEPSTPTGPQAPVKPAAGGGDKVLVVATPAREREWCAALERSGLTPHPHGIIGVDRALREHDATALLLDAEAFRSSFESVFGRLVRRGLLERVAAVVVGAPTDGADACVELDDCRPTTLAAAVKAAIAAKAR